MEAALTPSSRPFKNSTLISLIASIRAAQETNLPDLELLQNEFYYRFKSYLYHACVKFASSLPRPHDECAKDLFQETFIRAFKSLKTFKVEVDTEERAQLSVKAWLGKIANREGLKYIEKNITNSRVEYYDELPIEACELTDVGDEPINSANEIRLIEALSTLPSKSLHVLRTYAIYDCIETGKHLPQEEMENLCDMYQTTSENIRQIKKRALDKLKKIIAQ